MRQQLSQEYRDALAEVAKESFYHFRGVLELTDQPIRFRWSNQLTASAGNVAWTGGHFLVKLSAPIFRHIVLSDGWPKAEDAVKQTMMHELCHIPKSGRRLHDHGYSWARNVQLCGYDPEEVRRHSYTCGRKLYGADSFRYGETVEFEHNGGWLEGVIVKKNTKRARVELADGTVWNVPYSLLE